MRRLILILMSMVFVVGMGTTLLAQPDPAPARPRRVVNRTHGLARILQNPDVRTKLGITNEQFAKLQTTFLNSSKNAIRGKADLKIKHIELTHLMNADKVDRAQVEQKIDEISALRSSLMKNQIDARLTFKETLTADQLNKLREWRESQRERLAKERMQRRMGMMRRPGMGPQGPPPSSLPPKPGGQPDLQ
ncbi:MAG: periplasmic heavy metal sensor [Terriglobia bacterium]